MKKLSFLLLTLIFAFAQSKLNKQNLEYHKKFNYDISKIHKKIKYTPLNYVSITKQTLGDNNLVGITDIEFVGNNVYMLAVSKFSNQHKIIKLKNNNFSNFQVLSAKYQKTKGLDGWYDLTLKGDRLAVGEGNKIYLIDTSSITIVDSLTTTLNTNITIAGLVFNPKDNSYYAKAFSTQNYFPVPTNLYQISHNGIAGQDFTNDYPTLGLAIDTINNIIWQSSQIGDDYFSVYLSMFDLNSFLEVTAFEGYDPWNNHYGYAQGACIIYNFPGQIGKPVLAVTYNLPDPANDIIGGVVFYKLENVPVPLSNFSAEVLSNGIKIYWDLINKSLTNKTITIDSIVIFKNNKRLDKILTGYSYIDNTQVSPEILVYSSKVYYQGNSSPTTYSNKLAYKYLVAEDFENYDYFTIPDNWFNFDINQDNSKWMIYDWPVHSGYSALYIENKPGSLGLKDDICLTDKFTLDKNKTYIFTAYAMTMINSQDKLAFVLVQDANNYDISNVKSYIKDTLWISSNFGNVQYTKIQILYEPKESGDFRLGIWALTDSPLSFMISVDDITFVEAVNLSNLNKPQNPKATSYLYNKIRVQWEIPEYTNAPLNKYLIYRNGVLYDSTTTTIYFDKNVIAEKYYAYYIVAKYQSGLSEPTNTVFGYALDGTYPTFLEATNVNSGTAPLGRVILKINAAPAVADTTLDIKNNFIGYLIYRNNQKYDTIKSFNETVFYYDRNILPFTNYSYKVTALYTNNIETQSTITVLGSCFDASAPTELTATLGLVDKISLKWKPAVNVFAGAEGFEDYLVPSNWTAKPKLRWKIVDNDKDNLSWFLVTDVANTGKMSVGCYSRKPSGNFPVINSDDYLITPQKIKIPVNAKLKFWLYSFANYENEKLNIKISENSDAISDFINLSTITKTKSGWEQFEIDLSSAAGKDIYIAFNHFSSTSDTKVYALLLDDIQITSIDLLNYIKIFSSDNYSIEKFPDQLIHISLDDYSDNKIEKLNVFQNYKIYRNNQLIGSTQTSNFIDTSAQFGIKQSYYIKAVYDNYESLPSNTAIGMAYKSSQILENRDFENNMMPGGWKVVNVNNDNKQWKVLKSSEYNYRGIGKYFLGMEGNSGIEPNDWVFTKGYQLIKDDTLKVSLHYSCNYYTTTYGTITPIPQSFSVYLMNGQNPDNKVQKLLTLSNITNIDVQFIDTLVKIPVDGNYYIGFHCHSPINTFYSAPSNLLVLDNIITYHFGNYVVSNEIEKPKTYNFELSQNYPNPFNPTTNIKFTLPEYSYVTLKIYNLLGQEVKNIISDNLEKGIYNLKIDMTNFATGIYYYKIVAKTNSGKIYNNTKKMLLMK